MSSFPAGRAAAPGLDVVSSRITPSVQRLLDRLVNNPVAVDDATSPTLRLAAARYPADQHLKQLTRDLAAQTADAERLTPAIVLGTQAFIE